MKSPIFLLLSTIICLNAGWPSAEASDLCSSSEGRAYLSRPETLGPLENLGELAGAKDLVLIGEFHHQRRTSVKHEILKVMKEKWADEKAVCLLYELPSDKTIKEEFVSLYELLNYTGDGPERSLRTPEADGTERINRDDIERIILHFSPLHASATELGYNEITVDLPRAKADISIQKRDDYMVKKITSLFQKGECTKAVMFIGKSHIAKSHPKRRTLSDLIKRENRLKLLTANLQDAPEPFEGQVRELLASWNGLCVMGPVSKPLPSPEKPMVFKNDGLPKNLRLHPFQHSSPERWREFDITILHP